MKHSLFFLSLASASLTFSHLQADKLIVLDTVMSEEEQKKTGITKLSFQEKLALEDWLNKTFVLKVQEEKPQTPLSLSINIDNGKKLLLSDNSVWEIAPDDLKTSAIWITPFPVKITPSNNPNYPFIITNTNSGMSVKARKAPPENQTGPSQPKTPPPASSPSH